jgi:hypothetical protein
MPVPPRTGYVNISALVPSPQEQLLQAHGPIIPRSPANDHAVHAARKIHERYFDGLLRSHLTRMPEPNVIHFSPEKEATLRCHTASLLDQIRQLQAVKYTCTGYNLPLEFRICDLQAKINSSFWRLFRINDLPPEILTNIFRYVVWSTGIPLVGIRHRLWLTWVCRRWRAHALADLTMWNAIWIRDTPPYERSSAWLDRAGTAPLDIRINECDMAWNEEDKKDTHILADHMRVLLESVFLKLEQIRMLIIVVDTWCPAMVVLDMLRDVKYVGRAHSLQRFELHRTGTPWAWLVPSYNPIWQQNRIPLFGGHVPTLKYICLNGVSVDWNTAPFVNLTTLDLRRMPLEASPTLSKFRQMLLSSPRLWKLALDGCGPRIEPVNPTMRPVELSELTILVLGDFNLAYTLYVLSHIAAPNIRDLTLMNLTREDYWPLAVKMTSMFKQVRLLTMYTVEMGTILGRQKDVVKWIQSMPELCYLRIAQLVPSFLDLFLHDLAVYGLERPRDNTTEQPPGSSSRVDNVEGLDTGRILAAKLEVLEYQSMPTAVITSFGRARLTMGVPLKKIYVNSPWVPSVTPEGQKELGSIARLYITHPSASTPEEQEILGSQH